MQHTRTTLKASRIALWASKLQRRQGTYLETDAQGGNAQRAQRHLGRDLAQVRHARVEPPYRVPIWPENIRMLCKLILIQNSSYIFGQKGIKYKNTAFW